MYPEINLVAQSGIVKWPSLKYNAKGQPEFRFTLAKAGTYPWSMPCCAIGHTAEKLASDLDEGMAVLISAAELCYRKRLVKGAEVSRMEVLVWHAQVGQSAQDDSIPGGSVFLEGVDEIVAHRGDERVPATKGRPPRPNNYVGKASALRGA
jgi:hypothetical protein